MRQAKGMSINAWQVKENFERFISCKSTIDDIHLRLKKAEGDYGDGADGASTADMVAAVADVSLMTPISLHCNLLWKQLAQGLAECLESFCSAHCPASHA